MEEGAWSRSSLQPELGRGRAGRRASVPDPPTSPWEAAVLGTREKSSAAERDSLQVLNPRGHRTVAGGPSFCVGLELTFHITSGWLWPCGCGS